MPTNTPIDTAALRTKILLGLDKAFQKLLLAKQKEDGELVFGENGKIVIVKARQLRNLPPAH